MGNHVLSPLVTAVSIGPCQKVDPCYDNPCENGQCSETVAGFNCTCDTGYNGKTCQHNMNECISVPCQNGGTCEDGIDHYLCSCISGFTGHDCSFII